MKNDINENKALSQTSVSSSADFKVWDDLFGILACYRILYQNCTLKKNSTEKWNT